MRFESTDFTLCCGRTQVRIGSARGGYTEDNVTIQIAPQNWENH